MLNVLKKNWQFTIGTIIGIVGILISVWLAIGFDDKKLLSYELTSVVKVGYEKSDFKNLKFSYLNNNIENGAIYYFKILNNGQKPVVSSDFEGPIKIIFSKNTHILDKKITKVYPDNLNLVV